MGIPQHLNVGTEVTVNLPIAYACTIVGCTGENIEHNNGTNASVKTDRSNRATNSQGCLQLRLQTNGKLIQADRCGFIVKSELQVQFALQGDLHLKNDGNGPYNVLRIMLEGVFDLALDRSGCQMDALVLGIFKDQLSLNACTKLMLVADLAVAVIFQGNVALIGSFKILQRTFQKLIDIQRIVKRRSNRFNNCLARTVENGKCTQSNALSADEHLMFIRRKIDCTVLLDHFTETSARHAQVNVQGVIVVILRLGLYEANVVSKGAIEELVEEASLVVRLCKLLVALLCIRVGIGSLCCHRENDLAVIDLGFNRDLVRQLDLKLCRAKQLLEDLGSLLQRDHISKAQVDVIRIQFEIDYIDIQNLSAFQNLIRTVLYGNAYLNGQILFQVRCRNGKGAVVPVHLCLGRQLRAILNQREHRIRTSRIPETEHLDGNVLIHRLNGFLLGAVCILYGVRIGLAIKRDIQIRRLAVDILVPTADAIYVGLLRHGQIGDQHIEVDIHILVVSVVAFLLCVNVDHGANGFGPHQRGEIHSAKLIRIEIELVRYPYHLLLACFRVVIKVDAVNCDDEINVGKCGTIGSLYKQQIVVGLNRIVRHVGHHLVRTDLALAPKLFLGCVFGILTKPIRFKSNLKARIKAFWSVIVDLLANLG